MNKTDNNLVFQYMVFENDIVRPMTIPYDPLIRRSNAIKLILDRDINPQIRERQLKVHPYCGCLEKEKVESKQGRVRRVVFEGVQNLPLDLIDVPDMVTGRIYPSERSIDIALTINDLSNKILGVVYFSVNLRLRNTEIVKLAIDEDHQGKGLGSILLESAMYLSCLHGTEIIYLETSPDGIPTYLKHGFFLENSDFKENSKEIYEEIYELWYGGEKPNLVLNLAKENNNNFRHLKSSVEKHAKLPVDITEIFPPLFLGMQIKDFYLTNIESASEITFPEEHATLSEKTSFSEKTSRRIDKTKQKIDVGHSRKFTALTETRRKLSEQLGKKRAKKHGQRFITDLEKLEKAVEKTLKSESIDSLDQRRLLLSRYELSILNFEDYLDGPGQVEDASLNSPKNSSSNDVAMVDTSLMDPVVEDDFEVLS